MAYVCDEPNAVFVNGSCVSVAKDEACPEAFFRSATYVPSAQGGFVFSAAFRQSDLYRIGLRPPATLAMDSHTDAHAPLFPLTAGAHA